MENVIPDSRHVLGQQLISVMEESWLTLQMPTIENIKGHWVFDDPTIYKEGIVSAFRLSILRWQVYLT